MNRGIQIQTVPSSLANTRAALDQRLRDLGLHDQVLQSEDPHSGVLSVQFKPKDFEVLTPAHDTLGLPMRVPHAFAAPSAALMWEIWVAWLCAPIPLKFDSWEDLESAQRLRHNLSRNASKTSLNFRTEEASRPDAYWTYREDSGYVLLPHADLVESLIMATQPEVSGATYAFSCYRATEYVLLLSIAQEAREHNHDLYEKLQKQWREKAISSRQFHASFLHEIGEVDAPLPMTWYVPGDRIWFKNPHPLSSDATGYEGSWVIYLGQGLFCNFWDHRNPYTLDHKCVELYHWRHGFWINKRGTPQIDEDVVTELTNQTLSDPIKASQVLSAMKRYRDPQGVYAGGGCIDSTREMPRKVMPWNCEVELPQAA